MAGDGGCRRCSTHSIDYPPHVQRCMVDGCNNYLSWFQQDHDEDWRDKLNYYNDLTSDVTSYKLIDPNDKHLGAYALPDVQFNVAVFEGHLWIPHEELIKAGYLCLEDFSVVKIRGKFYELQAHIGRTLTHGIKGGAWWVEEIDPESPEFAVPDYVPEGGDTNDAGGDHPQDPEAA